MVNLPGQKILLAVGQYYGLTNAQIGRLLFRGNHKYAQLQTKHLREESMLRVTHMPLKGAKGSAASCFFLTDRGRAFLRDYGVDLTGVPQHLPVQGSHFLRHLEAVNDVLISAATLEGVELLGLKHDRELRALKMSVVPDGWVGFKVGEEKVGICFEVDLGTEYQTFFKEKVAKLLQFGAGEYKQLGLASLTVAITTPRAERARHVLTWIEEVLRARGKEHWGELFRVTPVSPLQVEPQHFFCEPWWGKPFSQDYVSLLEGVSPG